MIIETQNYCLRSLVPEDLDDYYTQIYGDADVMKYISGGQTRNRERTNDVLTFMMRHERTYGYSLWALLNRADDIFIGHCGLIHAGESSDVEVACALGNQFQKKGVAPEVVIATFRYAFETVGLEKVIALADSDNMSSQKVMAKLGMKYVGLTDDYYHANLIMYEIERANWQPSSDFYRLTP